MKTVTPMPYAGRIITLDILRGIAILGILIMNVQAFSMIEPAYMNPTAYGDFTGINKWIWILSHTLAEQKFYTIFSMLFGVGILIFAEKAKVKAGRSWLLHYRRMFWLLIIGLAHAYLVYYGDILVTYAITGMVIYWLRKLKPGLQLTLGLFFFAIPCFYMVRVGLSIPDFPPQVYTAYMNNWVPDAEAIASETAVYTGSYRGFWQHLQAMSNVMQTYGIAYFNFWRAGGCMLIGMAFYKWDILSAARDKSFYLSILILGLGTGMVLIIYGIIQQFQHEWSLEYSKYLGIQFNYWGSIFMASGYIAGIILLYQSNYLSKLLSRIAAVGRMALTNYLMDSVILGFLFYGFGLGLFGQVERTGQVLIVFSIWILQLMLSPWWFKHFNYGPVEWLWRSLTYWKWQPFARSNQQP